MGKYLVAAILTVVFVPALVSAQAGGAFVGSLGLGMTSAQGDFADGVYGFSGGSGIGVEAELRFYLWGGFGIGGFVNHMRFGSSHETSEGRLSFNYSQLGGLAKMNFIPLSNGAIYLTGGGGVFTPATHYYIPDNSRDEVGDESGYFGFGGIGLVSITNRRILYELEFRYNIARADYTLDEIDSNVWDFVYVGIKLSFASKGKPTPPRY
jgi:hypothetical protein